MKKLFIAVLAAFTLIGCSLDESPYAITKEALGSDPKGADQLVKGIYEVLWGSYLMKKTYIELIDMDHDHIVAENWVLAGAGDGNNAAHTWAYDTGSDPWNAFYQIISRSNAALDALEVSGAYKENARISQSYGEALFLRAWAYFHLVRMYGPVPLRLESVTPVNVARSSVTDVFQAITNDLTKASNMMSYKSSSNVGAWGHADKTAAIMLLAKVYTTLGSYKLASQATPIKVVINGAVEQTFTGKNRVTEMYAGIDAKACYEAAVTLCDTLINRRGMEYDLIDGGFKNIWGNKNTRNKEFVWGAVSHSIDNYKTEHLHYYYSTAPFGGTMWVSLAMGLYNQYEKDDTRATDGVFHYYKISHDGTSWYRFPSGDNRYNTSPENTEVIDMPASSSSYTATGMPYSKKWYLGDINSPDIKNVTDNAKSQIDVILLRFVEVFLLKAEAANELGNMVGAKEALNVVRTRSNASEITTNDQLELRSYILRERALELSQEFNRKFDLYRWGIYLPVMNATGTIPAFKKSQANNKTRTDKSLLYAVPTGEVNANSLFGPNNLGY